MLLRIAFAVLLLIVFPWLARAVVFVIGAGAAIVAMSLFAHADPVALNNPHLVSAFGKCISTNVEMRRDRIAMLTATGGNPLILIVTACGSLAEVYVTECQRFGGGSLQDCANRMADQAREFMDEAMAR